MNFNITYHKPKFTHSINANQFPIKWREVIRIWGREANREDRLFYDDGNYYLLVPFDWMDKDNTNIAVISEYQDRYIQLMQSYDEYDQEDEDRLNKLILEYGNSFWKTTHYSFIDYLCLISFMYYLKSNLPEKLLKPDTLAIYIEY